MADRMPDMPKRAGGRPWYLRLALAGVVLVLLLGVPLGVLDFAGQSSLNRQVEAIRAAGQPVTYEELEAARPQVPDDENGALLLQSLADRLDGAEERHRNNRELPGIGRGEFPRLGEPYPAELMAALDACLADEADLIDAIDGIRDRARGRLPSEIVSLQEQLPRYSPVRNATRLKMLDAVGKVRDGRLDAAALDSIIIMNIAGSVAGEPLLIGALLGAASDGQAGDLVERVLAAGECRGETLIEVGRAMDEALVSRSMTAAMWGERVYAYELIVTGRAKLTEQEPFLVGRSWYTRGWGRWELAKALSVMAPLAKPQTSVMKLIASAKAYDSAIEALPKYRLLSRALLPALTRAFELHGRRVAELRCAIVGLAVERYRLKYGNWPETLARLVPDFLPELPVDPFDEQPLRYLRDDNGVVVYSVGENGTDDQGEVLGNPAKKQRPADTGFRLFKPGLRGFVIADEETGDGR